MVGSIGVLATQVDWSQWNEKLGLGVTYIHAGKRFGHRKPPSPRTGFTGYDRCSRLPASAHVAVINMPPQTLRLRLLASELEILEALWRIGAATIIEVHRALPRRSGYTTVQTRLNRMVKKKLLRRSRSRPARYTPSITREQVSSSDLGLLLDKVSRGRVIPLVAHLVRDHSLTPAEIAELKQLIREAEARAAAEQDSRGET